MEQDYLERLCSAEERGKSNTHRLDRLEALAEELHAQGQSLAVMCSQLETQGETLTTLTRRVSDLEQKPGERWDKVIGAIIGAVVGVVIGMIFAGM